MTRRHLATALLFLAAVTATAQEAPRTDGPLQSNHNPGPSALITTKDVLSLHQAGIDDSILLTKLTQQNTPMSLSTEDLLQLKAAGVSDPVVRAMLQPPIQPQLIRNVSEERLHSMSPTGATPDFGTDTVDFDNPLAPHESGIYLARTAPDGSTKLTFLERASTSGVSVGGMLGAMATFGIAPMSMKFNVQNGQSNIRTLATDPVFYFYFDDRAAGLGKTPFAAASASSPNQFQLERMSSGKHQRQLLAAKVSITGAKTGGNSIPFHLDRLHAGLYKVVPDSPLKPGEYCFLLQNTTQHNTEAASNQAPPDIFDFGIDGPSTEKQRFARR